MNGTTFISRCSIARMQETFLTHQRIQMNIVASSTLLCTWVFPLIYSLFYSPVKLKLQLTVSPRRT